jgi:hypothetical protein
VASEDNQQGRSGSGRIDRRAFLEGATWLGAVGIGGIGWDAAFATQKRSTAARLPDGSEFPLWEQPLTFTKTYYVDNGAPAADDAGPGDRERPFRTIGRAAEILQPGERVIIAEGIYRECVRPVRGGTGPSQMISYEAAPGAKVYIRGSEALKDGWKQAILPPRQGGPSAAATATIWRHDLSEALFPDAYNPFALPSIMGSWEWLDPTKVDMGPYLRRRGLVFVDGKPLEPMEQLFELAMPNLPPAPDFTRAPVPQNGLPGRRRGGPVMQEIGGSPNARFWTDYSGTAIYVRLPSGTPADHTIEITTRQHTFIPAHSGIGFVRVKGLIFQHAGNAYPFPQFGMVSLAGGDHWILEDNVLEWANGVGLDIGFDGDSAGAPNPGASIVVRGNQIRYCGVEGIGGMGTTETLIEDNLIERCGWADAERGWEASATKFHRAKDMLYRRNVIRHIRHGNGAWWDVGNSNCRVTQNIFADIQTVSAAVHFEMTTGQNAIDNNIIWDVRNAEPGTPGQRGCAGSGIFDNATSNLIIAQNLIGRCDNAGVFTIVRPDRGHPTADGNLVANNIFASCKAGIVFLSANNKADGNVYADMPAAFQGFVEASSVPATDPQPWRRIEYMGLASWRASHDWDRNSIQTAAEIRFDPDTLQLTIAPSNRLPRTSVARWIETDLPGRQTGSARIAGPLARVGNGHTIVVDPRRRPR